MHETMSSLVAEYTRRIVQEVQTKSNSMLNAVDAGHSELGVGSPNAFGDQQDDHRGANELTEVDFRVAETLRGGTKLFPDPDMAVSANWYVFVAPPETVDEKNVCYPIGVIQAGLDSKQFVDQAYRLVLMREADETGQNLYPPLIENRQLTHRDVLKILADSEEALSREINLVIIPEPSSWLNNGRCHQAMPHIVEKVVR